MPAVWRVFPHWVTHRPDLVLWSIPSRYSPSSLSFSVLSWSSSSCFFMKTDSSVKVIETFSSAPASDEEMYVSQLWSRCQHNNTPKKPKHLNGKYTSDIVIFGLDVCTTLSLRLKIQIIQHLANRRSSWNYIKANWASVGSCCIAAGLRSVCQYVKCLNGPKGTLSQLWSHGTS